MDNGSPRSLLDRLLGMAMIAVLIAVLLVVAVHLIESVMVALLIGLLVVGGIGVAVLVFQRCRDRY